MRSSLRRHAADSISDVWTNSADGNDRTPSSDGLHRCDVPLFDWELPRLRRDDPKLGGGLGGFDARVHTELGVNGGEVVADGLRRHKEPDGDLAIAQPRGNQGQHLRFPSGQTGRMSAGGGAW